MAQMKFIPLSELVDEIWGPIGTPKRDAMEAKLRAEVESKLRGTQSLDETVISK